MARGGPIARTACGLLTRGTVGFFGLMAVILAIGPTSESDSGPRSRPDGPESSATSIRLRLPDGELSRTLVVVDAAGDELATLTHYQNGDTTLVARPDGGAGVSCWFKRREGSARLTLTGAARETRITLDRKGVTRTSVRALPGLVNPRDVARPRSAFFSPGVGVPVSAGPVVRGSGSSG